MRFAAGSKIPVAFHVVRTSATGWNISDTTIQAQLNVLNGAYSSMNLSFFIQSIQRHVKPAYAIVDGGTVTEQNMKNELAITPKYVLNVYFVENAGEQGGNPILGYAYLPDAFPDDNKRHGCVVWKEALPGTSLTNFNEGDTLTHEVGHYLGLFHTFYSSTTCAESDGCADTPIHKMNTGKPPVGTDTCTGPSFPGLDPIRNYMNYVDDDWMWEFTNNQAERAYAVTSALKPTAIDTYLWRNYTWFSGNWRYVPWYQDTWIHDTAYPWIWTSTHGWQYSESTNVSDIWFWDTGLGWLWTTETMYGSGKFYFSVDLNVWIQYISGISPRVFLNTVTMQTFTVQPGQRTGI